VGGKFERSKRLEHQTLGVQRLAVRSEDYWEYKPEQRVQTIDGVTGVVKHVEDGPIPGSEEYEVVLDRGLGGGRYTASQLSPAPITTEAMEQTAAVDYPELSQILVERPDPARQFVTAGKNPFADSDSDEPDSDDSESDDDSGEDDSKDSDNDSNDKDDDDSSDGDDDTPPWVKKASSLFADLVVTAAADADFRFHITAAWRDVVAKAKRLRAEGRLRVTMASDGYVFAEVKGDHHVYETGLQRMPGKVAAHSWSCGCKWGAYHWGADDDFSRFAGRMCSHALALQYEAQSRGMFGRDVHTDEHKPTWVPRHVVVRYDIDADTNRLAPSTAVRREAAVNPHGLYLRFGDWPHDGRSKNNITGGKEDGVSVYDVDHKGNPMDPDPHFDRDPDEFDGYLNDTHQEMHDRAGKAEKDRYHGEDDPSSRAHLVRGEVVGFGHDSEPLLNKVHRVGDWMDHRHLLIPTAEPHRLARTPDHPDYAPPEENPGHGRTAGLDVAPLSVISRAAVAAGEDREELLLALAAAGISPGQGELFDAKPFKVEKQKSVPDREQFGDDENGHRYHVNGRGERFYPCFNKHCPEGGKHEDGESAKRHRDVYTDWNTVHPTLPDTLHRGMAVSLPDDVHKIVHDGHRPTSERAKALSDHLREGGMGTHWTPDHDQARHYSGITDGQDRDTHVILHAHTPSKRAIETDPDTLADQDVISMGSHDDAEVPLRHGAGVSLKGISWQHRTDDKWTRHDFDKPVKHTANANSPFGEPSGTSYQLPKTPGATAPKRPWENPASAGPLAGGDPAGWNRQLPLQSYAHGGLEAALFEPGGTEAELHDEPEGALPATDGAVPTDEASDLTPSMTAGLKRQALKDFSLAEQQALINEGEGVRAANLDRLDIKGTHYADLEHVLAAQEDDTTWLE
jgi:hypothetical protein